ncbi:MAG TPA: DUF2381 family protein [Myxococcales bacterium]|jgi:uncharacterized protein (TIGR02268 family)|nr:DUF2381 family protein [Myxococcales bacterium]
MAWNMRWLAVGALALSAWAQAQPECLHRWRPWEPQRTGIFFSKGQPDQPVPSIHVAGEAATNLMFPGDVDPERTKLVGGDGRFEPLMISRRSVVIVPVRDLASDESFSLLVTLKDGTEIPFSLKAPRAHDTTDGQVDVHLDQDDDQAIRRMLLSTRSRMEKLTAENERHAQEELSADHALAALLAGGKVQLTPFAVYNTKLLEDDGVALKVVLYKRRIPKIDLDRSAVVFELTNNGDKRAWEFDEVRLLSIPSMESWPFAMRASSASVGPGETGRFAMVIATDSLKTGADADQFLLELWRAGGSRQAAVELVAVDDTTAPLQLKEHRKTR